MKSPGQGTRDPRPIFSTVLPILILIDLYILMFWAGLPDYRPGMDSMTYGAIAKHILETGDWARLHYTQEAYPNFFQHPPLAIWMMALSMKILGTADWVLKVLPSLFAGIGVVFVYRWGKRVQDEWLGFLAALILLTSTRFVKYSKGFMLDPFLAVFSVAALFLLLHSFDSTKNTQKIRTFGFQLAGGASIGAALLSKGLFAFAPAIAGIFVILAYAVAEKNAKAGAVSVSAWLGGIFIILAPWFLLGGAEEYLHRYYVEHVATRITPHPLSEHLEPLRNLLKVYWPWLPLYLYGAVRILRHRRFLVLSSWEGAALLTSLGFLGGFVLSGSFLEQYHTSFYPFAALVAGYSIAPSTAEYRARILTVLAGLILAANIAMIGRPSMFRGTESRNPIRIVLKKAAEECGPLRHQQITISKNVAEIWYAIAMGSWNTPWDARSGEATKGPAVGPSDLLLAKQGEKVAKSWKPSTIAAGDYQIFFRAPSPGEQDLCRKGAP